MKEYSISYSSATVGTGGNIVLPGGTSELCSQGSGIKSSSASNSSKGKDKDVEGIVITPEATGIVIKTHLLKADKNILLFKTDGASSEQSSDGEVNDAKIFLNICTHPMIEVPGQRKGLDDETGDEVQRWRLPMSMGELRPCYDKTGRSAIVADCILNPNVVTEMNDDSRHFHFVCDLVVQCATRKFGPTWFGGQQLDRRFKLPKMRYAGYVDEVTGLPVTPECALESPEISQRPVVAKQRIKNKGSKNPIIEEVDTSIERVPTASTTSAEAGGSKKLLVQEVHPNAKSQRNEVQRKEIENPLQIELFIKSDSLGTMSLFEFLRMISDRDEVVPSPQPTSLLRKLIASPKRKLDGKHLTNKSHQLSIPIPFDIGQESTLEDSQLKNCCIIAKCNVKSSAPITTAETLPDVAVSAYLIELSVGSNQKAKIQCTLPFPVDTQLATSEFSRTTRILEISMPLLQTQLNIPDHGTRQWELQRAFGSQETSKLKDPGVDIDSSPSDVDDVLNSYFVQYTRDDETSDEDGTTPLPEDHFHQLDALSLHLLKQQEEERNKRATKGREDTDVEYVDVKDFQPGGKYFAPSDRDREGEPVVVHATKLIHAEKLMKQKFGSALAFDLA